MAGDFRVRETRYLSGTTFNTTHTNAAANAWAAGTAVKIRVHDVDLSGLEYSSEPDNTMRSNLWDEPANIPTIRGGTVKFGSFAEGAYSNTTNNPVAVLLSKIMGGIQAPLNRSISVFAGGTSTALNVTAHGLETGQAVLAGAKGDTRGGAEVRGGVDTDANTFTVNTAFGGAPTAGDTCIGSTTVYFHDTTMQYLDFLFIGKDTTDQCQTIGGQCTTLGLTGLNPGEVPRFTYEITVGDWQEVASTDRDQLEPTSAQQGNQPALDRGLGMVLLADQSGTTRVTFPTADLTVDPGISFEPLPGANGINNIEGWVRVLGRPTASFKIPLDGSANVFPGIYDDFVAANGTAKELIIQLGNAATKCMAIEFPHFFFDAAPVRDPAGNIAAVQITGHGTAGGRDMTTAATARQYSPIKFHFF
jgi:hypothetical protein